MSTRYPELTMSNTGLRDPALGSLVLDWDNLVQVIGRGTRVKFVLDPSAPVEALEAELRTYLDNSRGWFAGGEVVVDAGERVLKIDELQRLKAIFEDEYKVGVASFECQVGVLQNAIREEYDVPVCLVSGEVPEPKPKPVAADNTLFVKANCRSGKVVKHPGDVVIFGDVNPGGKVIADGDVVVLGCLRGSVQAGANDGEDSDASIMALELRTARLQIGTRLYQHAPGKGKNVEVPLPVIARVRMGGVEVMPFTGSFRRRKERKPLWQERRM